DRTWRDPEPNTDFQGGDHPERYGLAVRQAIEPALRLERVADRVAEVQELPLAGLALVTRDDPRLHGDRTLDRRQERGLVACADRRSVALQTREHRGVPDACALHDLREAAPVAALELRSRMLDVHDHARRLMECADRVLRGTEIDARLPAHG